MYYVSSKTEYKTVSIPKPLAEDVQELIKEIGHWPSLSAFTREALITKIHAERALVAVEAQEGKG